MIEIKFRAWENKKMIYIGSQYLHSHNGSTTTRLHVYANGWRMVQESHFTERELFDNKTGKLMQYTGYNVKYNKELYAEDIVKQFDDIAIIKQCKGGFECKMIAGDCKGSTFNMTWINEDQCEIIGNTHENPELLEANQHNT